MKPLPIGIQTFSELRDGGYLYVDKTAIIRRLLLSGKPFFLSRPRRFGKSLLVSTIAEIFKGNKALFAGLDIENEWDWSHKHPIVHFDWSGMKYSSLEGLKFQVSLLIDRIARSYQVALPEFPLDEQDSRLVELIIRLREKTGEQVVVLIDEYDKPIQDVVGIEGMFPAVKTFLHSIYNTLKSCDPHLRFLFLTGVSKFSGVSVFSTLNNLKDITLNENYAGICGYTQEELESNFPERIDALAQKFNDTREHILSDIKMWYNGYTWDGKTSVYNPFSTLLLLDNGDFQNYWFDTATPTFLIKILRQREHFESVLGSISTTTLSSSSDNPFAISDYVLLFQTGYLTIKNITIGSDRIKEYLLDFPNREVRESFVQSLMADIVHNSEEKFGLSRRRLEAELLSGDAAAFTATLSEVLAWIPYQIIVEKEAYYHSILLLWLRGLGFNVACEISTNRGRIDAVWELSGQIIVAEIKYAEPTKKKTAKKTTGKGKTVKKKPNIGAQLDKLLVSAFSQIEEKQYAERYKSSDKKLTALAIACSGREVKCAIREVSKTT